MPKTPHKWKRQNISSESVIIVLVFVFYFAAFYIRYNIGFRPLDLGVYLSASNALLARQNPWNDSTLTMIAHANGYLSHEVRVWGLWTPPTVLLLLGPFSLLPFNVTSYLWIVLNLQCIVIVCKIIARWLPVMTVPKLIVISLAFPPFAALLVWGQISGLVLLGYVAFINFAQRRRDWFAGLSLLLTTFKPHLGFLVWIFLGFWILKHRRWRVFYGFLVGLVIALGLITLIHPLWLRDYQASLSNSPLRYEASTIFRIIHINLFPQWPWVQFAGVVISSLCVVIFLLIRNENLRLLPSIPFLLLLSVFFAPYGWVYDQVVTLPAYVWLANDLFRKHPAWFAWSVLAIPNLGYYHQIYLTWGDNDNRLFWFPLMMTVIFIVRGILDRNDRYLNPDILPNRLH